MRVHRNAWSNAEGGVSLGLRSGTRKLFLNALFPMRIGNVFGSVTVNGCQTGFLYALFPVANWNKNVPSAFFPATANAVLFGGGAFPWVALASLTPPTAVLLSPLTGLSKATFSLTFAMRKHALLFGDDVFNRIAVKGLQPWVQRSRAAAERNPRRNVPHCLEPR
jgi:hypothetical protein